MPAGPPVGDFRNWTIEDWESALNNNMLTPIELFRQVVDGMIERRFGRIINITSSSVKSADSESGPVKRGALGFDRVLCRCVKADRTI